MNEEGQDRSIVLAVVGFLGAFALIALLLIGYLVDHGADAATIGIITGPMGGALGALSMLLANAKTMPPKDVQKAQAQGYVQAVQDVQQMASPGADVPVVEAPAVVVAPNDGMPS